MLIKSENAELNLKTIGIVLWIHSCLVKSDWEFLQSNCQKNTDSKPWCVKQEVTSSDNLRRTDQLPTEIMTI